MGEFARVLEFLRIDVLDQDFSAAGEASVVERFVEALVALGQVDVFADHADLDLPVGIALDVMQALPVSQVGTTGPHVKDLRDFLVEVLFGEAQRHFVDRAHILGRDDGIFVDIAEERDLALDALLEEAVRTAEDDVRCETDRLQSLTECCTGLVFTSPAVDW